jgi:hypothetical protein
MAMEAMIDLKKMAQDTTFALTIKVKNKKWWQRRVWIVSLFAKFVRLVLGSQVEIEVDYIYDPSH